ncbi:DUF5994 family protein [Streptomyces sp. NPDC003401]
MSYGWRPHDRRGVPDGAWWPRSRDIAAELPALAEYLEPVTRAGLDAGAWEALPTRLVIDDRVVHIDSFPVGDDTVLITRGEQDLFFLLMVPPHATPDAARDARRRTRRGGRGRPRRQRDAGRSDPHRHRHRPGSAGDVRAISRRGPRAGPVRCGCRDGHGEDRTVPHPGSDAAELPGGP